MNLTREIEQCALNAWPPLQQMVLDGWLLRFADGFTRRANSVNPIHPGAMDVARKIALCEQTYRERGLRCVFKLTPLAHPPGLDAVLERLGFAREAETSVQVLERLPQAVPGEGELVVESSEAGDWLEAFSRMNEIAGFNRAALEGILAHMTGEQGFASLRVGGKIVACGLAVRERETVGLFDLVSDAGERRKGHGERLMTGLLAWAETAGAERAYLQVVCDNTPALRLYEKLGFREIYRYWYRVKG
jgi:ribosomal protein S18 acetylase RimI-like enzyme